MGEQETRGIKEKMKTVDATISFPIKLDKGIGIEGEVPEEQVGEQCYSFPLELTDIIRIFKCKVIIYDEEAE